MILLEVADTITFSAKTGIDLNSIIIISGFILTALGIIFNPRMFAKINILRRDIDKKLQEILIVGNKQYSIIKEEVKEIKNDIINIDSEIKDHNKFISTYIAEKGTIQCLDFVVADALKYVSEYDDEISNFIMFISKITIDAFKELMEIGVDNFTKELLNGKLKLARNKAFNNKYEFVTVKYLDKFKKLRLKNKSGEILVEQLLDINLDNVNSKRERYRNITEHYMQNLMKDVIISWNEYKLETK